MGYTHSWERRKEFRWNAYSCVLRDAACVLGVLAQHGVRLCGPDGRGLPLLTHQEIAFNGERQCGHEQRSLGITWPAKNAQGVAFVHTRGSAAPGKPSPLLEHLRAVGANVIADGSDGRDATKDSDVAGTWGAGLELRSRTCGGDCSHESFVLRRVLEPEEWQVPEQGRYLEWCKTAYKPYDLAVQCLLVIAKQHLGDAIRVCSDGTEQHWAEARSLCQELLGYGQGFRLDP